MHLELDGWRKLSEFVAHVPHLFQLEQMADSPPRTIPTRRRMTLQALKVVEGAVDDAREQPIAMTPAIRLALGWLLLDRVAEFWQAREFMSRLKSPPDPTNGPQAEYCRRRDMTIFMEAWRREVRRRDQESRPTG